MKDSVALANAIEAPVRTDSAASQSANTNAAALGSLGIFAGFSILYVLLRSGDIFAVDGAYRCLEVYRRQELFADGSNHLLYPACVFLWSRLAAFFGFQPSGPLSFFSLTEVMNCLAAAACLGILFWLAIRITRDWRTALGLVIFFGLSKAFFEQATNANQAILGLLWSFAGVLLAALAFQRPARWLFFLSGVSFAAAMASYQSMVFLGAAAVVLAGRCDSDQGLRLSRRFASVSVLMSGGVAGALAIYGFSYAFLRTRQTAFTSHNPLRIAGAHTWFGISFGKALNVPIGLVQNTFPVLGNFAGIRALLKGPVFPLFSFLVILAALSGLFMLCAAEIWRHKKSLTPCESTAVLAAIAGLAFTLIPVCVFSPNYDKLWLQPLACMALIVTIALTGKWKRTYLRRGVQIAAAFLLLAGVLTNFLWAIPSHRVRGIYGLAQAQQLTTIVRANDLVIGEWNPIPIIYQQLYAANGRYVDFTGQAAQKGEDAVRDLNQSILRTQQNGGHAYFIGLLDQSKAEWNGFLGSRCGVPYSAMNEYRTNSAVVAVLGAGADKIIVRRLN